MAATPSKHLTEAARQPVLPRLAGLAMSGLHTLLGLTLLFVVGVNVLNARAATCSASPPSAPTN
jgi:hypothetical protein